MASKPNAKICSLCDLFHVIACDIFGVISFNFLLVVRNFAKVTSPSFNNFCSLAVLHSRPICRYVGLWLWGPRRGCRYGLTGGWVWRSCWVEAAAAVTQHDLLTQPPVNPYRGPLQGPPTHGPPHVYRLGWRAGGLAMRTRWASIYDAWSISNCGNDFWCSTVTTFFPKSRMTCCCHCNG